MDLSEFEQYRENNRLEAKRAQGRDGGGELPRSMWETLSAFANEAGGVILLGVAEVGPEKKLEAVGLGKASKVLDDFWSAANSKDKLSARFLTDRNAHVETIDGKDIIVIEVPRVDRHMRPVYLDKDLLGKTFRRTHTGDHQCSEEEVFTMIRESSTQSEDAEIAQTASIGELDQNTITRYRRRFDSENENQDMAEVAAGLMGASEYRMRWYSEDEATARRRAEESFRGLWRPRAALSLAMTATGRRGARKGALGSPAGACGCVAGGLRARRPCGCAVRELYAALPLADGMPWRGEHVTVAAPHTTQSR